MVFTERAVLLAEGARDPAGGRAARGKPIVNLLNIGATKLAALVPVRDSRTTATCSSPPATAW